MPIGGRCCSPSSARRAQAEVALCNRYVIRQTILSGAGDELSICPSVADRNIRERIWFVRANAACTLVSQEGFTSNSARRLGGRVRHNDNVALSQCADRRSREVTKGVRMLVKEAGPPFAFRGPRRGACGLNCVCTRPSGIALQRSDRFAARLGFKLTEEATQCRHRVNCRNNCVGGTRAAVIGLPRTAGRLQTTCAEPIIFNAVGQPSSGRVPF